MFGCEDLFSLMKALAMRILIEYIIVTKSESCMNIWVFQVGSEDQKNGKDASKRRIFPLFLKHFDFYQTIWRFKISL